MVLYYRLSLFTTAMAVLLGIMPLLFLPAFPANWLRLISLLISVLLLLSRKGILQFIGIVLLVFEWAAYTATTVLQPITTYAETTQTLVVNIKQVILSPSAPYAVFATVEQIGDRRLSVAQQFQITMMRLPSEVVLKAGQRWQIKALLQPVHTLLNEGGFNSQRYAVVNRRVLNAIVREAVLLNQDFHVRQYLIDIALLRIGESPYKAILVALAFGERALLTAENKALLNITGTAHLMAISGMHIALASMLGFWLARIIQFLLPIRAIHPYFPLTVGWFVACCYVFLSGANPPAMRALIALSFFIYLRLSKQKWRIWTTWSVIVALLLLSDPLMILSESFWLSCSAVGCLFFFVQWCPLPVRILHSKWRRLVQGLHLQIGILLLLAPLQIYFFQGVSLSSLLANFFAIPMISFITLPLILFSLALTPLFSVSQWSWALANISLEWVFTLLNYCRWGWFAVSEQYGIVIFSGWIFVVLWRFHLLLKGILLSMIALGIAFLSFPMNDKGKWHIDMLDIGHGLAMVIRRGHVAILYDVANAYDESSLAERVILPFLRHKALQVEGIIISHEDRDHHGGLAIIQQYFPKAWLRSASFTLGGLPCTQGKQWQWQGLQFEVLWPPKRVKRVKNKDSCVIKLSDGIHEVLLTGDLEAKQEAELVAKYGPKLQTDIIQVPHHGSNTSSSALFLRTVKPQIALSSNSRFNRWRLPAKKVHQRYHKYNIEWYTTARWGQMTLSFSSEKRIVTLQRKHAVRWYHNWFGEKTARFESSHL